MTTHAPRIGITMGDPAGVGPEITVKALAVPEVAASCRAVVVGSGDALAAAIDLLRAPVTLRRVKAVEDCRYASGTVECLDLANVDMASLPRGAVSPGLEDLRIRGERDKRGKARIPDRQHLVVPV